MQTTKTLAELRALRRTYSLITAVTCYALVMGSDLEARVALGVTVLIWLLSLSALQADIRTARSVPANPTRRSSHEEVADDHRETPQAQEGRRSAR